MLRATQHTVTFAAIDAVAPPARKSGIIFTTGDCKIWNGSAFVNTTNMPAEIGSTGRYSLVLTAAELRGRTWLHVYVAKAGMQDTELLGGLDEQVDFAVVSGNATTFVTDLTSAITDYYVGALVRGTTGANAGAGTKQIVAYNGTTKAVTLSSPLPATPGAGDLFVLVTS